MVPSEHVAQLAFAQAETKQYKHTRLQKTETQGFDFVNNTRNV